MKTTQYYFNSKQSDVTFNVWASSLKEAKLKAQAVLPNCKDLEYIK